MSSSRSRAVLMRLRQAAVDEVRKELGALEARRQALVDGGAALEAQVLAERTGTLEHPAAQFAHGAFLARIRDERAALDGEMAALDGDIEGVRARLQAAFLELKQLEIIERQRRDREARERAKADAQALDEVALQGYRRAGS